MCSSECLPPVTVVSDTLSGAHRNADSVRTVLDVDAVGSCLCWSTCNSPTTRVGGRDCNSTHLRHSNTTHSCTEEPPNSRSRSSMLSATNKSTSKAVCKNTLWLSPIFSVVQEGMRNQLQSQAELDVAHWDLLPRRGRAVCAGRHPAALGACFCCFWCHRHVCVCAIDCCCCCCSLLSLIIGQWRGRRRCGWTCLVGLRRCSCTLLLQTWCAGSEQHTQLKI
jgi:hypothetical protein